MANARRPRPGPSRWGAIVVVALAVVTSAVGCANDPEHSTAATATPVDVASGSCGGAWTPPRSGDRTFRVRNSGDTTVEVELMDRRNRVYARIETLAPGTTRDLRARIGPGRYLWRCATPTGLEKFSGIRTVRGDDVAGVEPYLPVANNDLLLPTLNLRTAIAARIEILVRDTDALVGLAPDGSIDDLRRAWLVAHLDYVRLGAAYGTFGELDDAIDGGPGGRELGVDDPSWTGFRKLEHLLWNDGSREEIVSAAIRLGDDVTRLRADFPTSTPEPNEAALRSQEILENSMELDLSGRLDQGSHSELADVEASIDATDTVLDALGPLLEARRPGLLDRARSDLTRLRAELGKHRAADGSFAALGLLAPEQRRRVAGRLAQALEDLSPVPRVLEISPNEVNE